MAELHAITAEPIFKRCTKCRLEKPYTAEFFGANNQFRSGLRATCRQCWNDKARATGPGYLQRLRIEILTHYSNGVPRCVCCGIERPEFLALDHLEGSSQEDYRRLPGSLRWYAYIRRSGFVPRLQVLCHNCNGCKEMHGHCVHRPETKPASFRRQGNLLKLPPLVPVDAVADGISFNACYECKRVFPFTAQCFPKHKLMTAGLLNICKECDREQHYRQSSARKRKHREQVFRHYCQGTPRCGKCGESTPEFLTIDHVHGNGAKHRKEEKINCICRWLVKENLPDGFRVACFNCNMARGFYSQCKEAASLYRKTD